MTIAPEDLRQRQATETVVAIDVPDTPPVPPSAQAAATASASSDGDDAPAERSVVAPSTVALAALLSTAGASWMVGGIFRNALLARALCLAGSVIGVGLIRLSYRLAKPTVAQYLVLPLAMLVGAIAVAPAATGGTANLPGLVADALRTGGLRQPPVAFDPGWRFLLVVLFAVVGAGAFTNAMRTARPRLAVIVPAVLTMGAAILQPPGGEVLSSIVGISLTVGSFAVAYGADLASDGSLGVRYEVRRLGRGLVLLVALGALMVGLARLGFLFPQTDKDKVIPPQKPPALPLEKDRELFQVRSPRPGPWRLGTLDVYDGKAWLLPPYDPKTIKPFVNSRAPETYTAEFTLVDMRGRGLPVPSRLVALNADRRPEYDPRTEVPKLTERVPRNFKYRVDAAMPPSGKQLNATSPAAPALVDEFGEPSMPAAPDAVLALLNEAPTAPFDRLQFVRDRLYANVIAAGSGQPIDISPARVAELLQPNAEATPYEITAAEAMLARWAGVPARIGFGFHGGDPLHDNIVSFRPKHGAVWLEAYFEGHGWVPLLGIPPRAKASLTSEEKNEDPRVKPTEDIAVPLFLPTRRITFQLLYEVVRYWALAVLPFVFLGAAAWIGGPWLVKRARLARRRRWGEARGPLGEVLVAYAELRDRCHDLNLGEAWATPVEFADSFVDDAEHDELAWLVTRVLWGDLRRDVRADDAEACRAMCKSVWRRMSAPHSAVNRVLAGVSRASLREPYNDEVPNLWWSWSPVGALRRSLRRVRSLVGGARLRLRPAAALLLATLAATALVSCGGGGDGDGRGAASASGPVPELPMVGELLGFTVTREEKVEERYRRPSKRLLVDDGRVYTFREGKATQGVLQIARFKPDVDSQDEEVQREVEKAIATSFRTYRFGTIRVRMHDGPRQRIFVWFPPDSNTLEVFVMRKEFADGLRVVRAAIAAQRGHDPDAYAGTTKLPVPPPKAVKP